MFWFEIPLLDLVFSSDRGHFFSFILRDENPSAVSGLLDYTRSVLYCVDLHITCCEYDNIKQDTYIHEGFSMPR